MKKSDAELADELLKSANADIQQPHYKCIYCQDTGVMINPDVDDFSQDCTKCTARRTDNFGE